jgi:branched-subunit amino acid permease
MNPQRIVGVVLVVVGVILLSVGINASHSLADQVSNTFTGRFTQATTWYVVGGIASALLGVLMVLVDLRRKTA